MRCKSCNTIIDTVSYSTVLIDPDNNVYAKVEEELCNRCIGDLYTDSTLDYYMDDDPLNSELGYGNFTKSTMTDVDGNSRFGEDYDK